MSNGRNCPSNDGRSCGCVGRSPTPTTCCVINPAMHSSHYKGGTNRLWDNFKNQLVYSHHGHRSTPEVVFGAIEGK